MVDADNGFGNALNVQRTVRMFERMGANACSWKTRPCPSAAGILTANR
jgi:2-methylisocitrate lyase-like PEP mutase family enzyme